MACSESRDGNGCGDHDTPFVFGQPTANLTTMERGKLTVMRGEVMDTRQGKHGGCADGDIRTENS